ncbi:MAG: ABC transporter substrate-binding protein, partial [Deltaproteobacteria bacterium]
MSLPRRVVPLLLVLSCAVAAGAAALSAGEARGKRIYLEGEGRHPVFAVLVKPGIKAPGSSFPCVKCHLENGEGQLEGGVRSANIGYYALTSDYPGVRPSGRSHPPYTAESLETAVTDGRDPAANELNPVHPRYEMAKEDLDDLVSYLRLLGRETVPGITDNEIRIGALLPESGPLSGAAREMHLLLSAYFAEVNAGGGLFGRRVRFVPVPFDPGRPEGAAAEIGKVLADAPVFCFLSNLGIPIESEAAKRLAAEGVPVVAPLLVSPTSSYKLDRNTFYLYASLYDQARVMLDFVAAGAREDAPRMAFLYPMDPDGEGGGGGSQGAGEEVRPVSRVGGNLSPRAVRRAGGGRPPPGQGRRHGPV